MSISLRIVVGGFLGLVPAGGLTWHYLQYVLGFRALGHDVYYLEDTRLWPVYQDDNEGGADCSRNVDYLRAVMGEFGLGDRWAYRDEASGKCFGLSLAQVHEVVRSADALINVSCSTWLRDEYLKIPVRALVDTDPMFTQIQYETQAMFTKGQPGLRQMVDGHTCLFTYGENIGAEDCRIPQCGKRWIPTRQPVCLEYWNCRTPPDESDTSYTTLMNWTAGAQLQFDDESWGQKDIEFTKLLSLPEMASGVHLAVAVGQTTGSSFPADKVRRAGWDVLDPDVCAGDWQDYQNFLYGSRGEVAVAKETYVKARTGWFSDRSACYLAAGRPVITQETGWSKILPAGTGLMSFEDSTSAMEALRAVEANYDLHAAAARCVAEEWFDSRTVLRDMLKRCTS